MKLFNTPPQTESELLNNATEIAGETLGSLAKLIGTNVPTNQKQAKGWIGEALESYLGASARSLPEPDFQHIGVELKTLPIGRNFKPKESTYVCTVPLTDMHGQLWRNSIVKRKLARVLWVPIEADPDIPFPQRRIGSAFLWSPNKEQEQDLRTDWEELMEMIGSGALEQINSRFGKVLQIRPKAANAKSLLKTSAADSGYTLPRGFYLRPAFTNRILLDTKVKI